MTKNIKYLLGATCFSFFVFWGANAFQNNFDNYLTAQISFSAGNTFPSVKNDGPKNPAPEINAQAAIFIRITPDGTKKMLLEKYSDKPLPVASLTKLMTALVIFEDQKNFDFSKVVTISDKAAGQGNTPKYGNLTAGEKYTLGKLAEMMLVYSSNDAAWALSEIIGTDVFIEKMNKRARDLGMNYTYFINPTGLDPKNLSLPQTNDLNYSTAGDLAKLTEYILKNQPKIFEITREGYELPIENGISGLKLNEGQSVLGGKTGFTKYAKGSLFFAFQDKKGDDFINIILGAETEESRIQEMQKIIDWLSL
jgi:serine-type D-Ala-D-Ala carboxypeptidase (penicillin-binding protein 5/6)